MSGKTIEVVVSPTGQTRLETKGFQGSECVEASRLLEAALGQKSSEQATAERFVSVEVRGQQRELG